MTRIAIDKNPPPEWAPCAPGVFGQLSRRLQRRRSRRAFLQTAAATTAAASVGALAVWFGLRLASGGSSRSVDAPTADITCDEVQGLADLYAQGELSDAKRDQIRHHVAACPQCGPLFKAKGIKI